MYVSIYGVRARVIPNPTVDPFTLDRPVEYFTLSMPVEVSTREAFFEAIESIYSAHLRAEGLFTPGVHPRLQPKAASKRLREQDRKDYATWVELSTTEKGCPPPRKAKAAWHRRFNRSVLAPALAEAELRGEWTVLIRIEVRFDVPLPDEHAPSFRCKLPKEGCATFAVQQVSWAAAKKVWSYFQEVCALQLAELTGALKPNPVPRGKPDLKLVCVDGERV